MGGTLSKPDPSRKFEVICAGYSRTGTSSMFFALEKLYQGPFYHSGTQIWLGGSDAKVKLWHEACDAKFFKKDKERCLKALRQIMDGYVGCLDTPANLFIAELMELYPDAKVVLTTRDADKWWTSFRTFLDSWPGYAKILTFPAPAIRWIPTIFDAFLVQGRELLQDPDELLKNEVREDKKFGPAFLQRYNESIINMVPKEKLLVIDVKEGWEPLTKFLGKPTPEEPFPNVNEAAMLVKQANQILFKLFMIWGGIFSVAGGGAYLAWRLLKH